MKLKKPSMCLSSFGTLEPALGHVPSVLSGKGMTLPVR